jgi:hypothetical protein
VNQNQQIVVPSALLDGMIQYVEVSSLTTKRAIDEVDVHRQQQKRASDRRSELLNHMVRSGVVAENQKQAAEAMLGSHAETMNLLKAAIDKIVELKGNTKRAGDVGEGVDASSLGMANAGSSSGNGEFNSLTSPMVGMKTAYIKESDRPLLALIGR